MDAQAGTVSRDRVEATPVCPERFAHFVLRTSNPGPMRDWYKTVLNARIVFENDFICFLTYDEEHHRVALINVPGLHKPDDKAWGLAHTAYSYATLRDLLSTWRRLKDAGIEPYRPINHGPTVSMYYHDPDGNSVELQVDAYPTKEGAAGFFETEAFRQNPIGVPFDPSDLMRRFEAGEPEESLLRRP